MLMFVMDGNDPMAYQAANAYNSHVSKKKFVFVEKKMFFKTLLAICH